MHGNFRATCVRPARDPGTRVLAALQTIGAGAGTLLCHRERPWASITFSGTRHTAAYAFVGLEAVAAGERFVSDLPEHEFTIPGQLVADATVKGVEHTLLPEPRLTVEVELLLLEES
jgi:hypothetical protein